MSSANHSPSPEGGRGTDSGSADAEGAGRDVAEPPGSSRAVVVGGGQVGRLIARRLALESPVHYVDEDSVAVERAARRHDATHVTDLTDRDALTAVVDGADRVVVATPRDATNLLVAQHCLSVPDAPQVVAVVADPRTHDAYPPPVVRVCAASTLVEALTSTLRACETPAVRD
jgi:uncharacterized protein YbjT (DUF2867 family)